MRRRRSTQLFVRLVVAMEEDALGRNAGGLRERQLTERRHVGADTFLCEHLEQGNVRKRLRAVDDQRVRRLGAVRARLGPDRLLAVDDERRSMLGGEAARGDAAEAQLTGVDAGGIGKKRKHRLLVSKSR